MLTRAHMEPFSTISIIGMCKNAGKTTVLNKMLSLFDEDTTLGITSIGMDGETVDIVTSTKKPEIYVRANTLVATAANLVKFCDITKEILATTGMLTPMGEVAVIRAMSDGYVRIGGPSMTEQLILLNDILIGQGANKVFIDGALSRRSLSAPLVSEATILCAGASYSPDISALVADTAHICELLLLDRSERFKHGFDKHIALYTGDNGIIFPNETALCDVLRKNPGAAAIFLKGAVTDAMLKPLLMSGIKLNGMELCAEDASKFLISSGTADKMKKKGIRLTVLRTINLIGVAVNPFSAYGMGFNASELLSRMSNAVGVPVFDVLAG